MIITRTPLRISLGGGGTDLPSYYREAGHGFLIAAAITKYVYIAVHRNFDDDLMLKYSPSSGCRRPRTPQHPLMRKCLQVTGVDRGVEITSMADIPAGTGLGSSGSFTVGVLKALRSYRHELVSNVELAEQACHIEIDLLGEPVGKQDQYIAAVGGLTGFEFHADEPVEIVPLDLTARHAHRLEDNLLLFFTGLRRSASDELAEQQAERPARSRPLRDEPRPRARDRLRDERALEAGDLDGFGALLTEQWRLKYERAPSAVHHEVDGWITAGHRGRRARRQARRRRRRRVPALLRRGQGRAAPGDADLGLEEVAFGIDYEGIRAHREPMTRTVAVLAGGLGTRVASAHRRHAAEGAAPRRRSPVPPPQAQRAAAARRRSRRAPARSRRRAIVRYVGDGSAWGLDVDVVIEDDRRCSAPAERSSGRPRCCPSASGSRTATRCSTSTSPPPSDSPTTGWAAVMTVLHNRDRWQPSNVSRRRRPRRVVHEGATARDARAHRLRLPVPAEPRRHRTGHRPFDLGVVMDRLVAARSLGSFEADVPFHTIGTPDELAETDAWIRTRTTPGSRCQRRTSWYVSLTTRTSTAPLWVRLDAAASTRALASDAA